jgi:hypothetical protein
MLLVHGMAMARIIRSLLAAVYNNERSHKHRFHVSSGEMEGWLGGGGGGTKSNLQHTQQVLLQQHSFDVGRPLCASLMGCGLLL